MDYEISVLTLMGISILSALSLNLITGFCGQISLGHAAFLGIGAYTSTILSQAGIPFFISLIAAILLSGFFGVIVGFFSLRVRHDFLAITTMGVGFVFIGVIRQQDYLGGEMGISGIPDSGMGKLGYLLFIFLFVIILIALSLYLKHSWMGFAFDTIADDEDTSTLLGIDVARYKLIAFALGTSFAGLAGALYAHNVLFIDPESFNFIESVTILCMVVIGGIGSVWGVVVASAFLSSMTLWFQFLDDYKLLVYGSLLFFVMRFSPNGLSGFIESIVHRINKKEYAKS